MHFNHLSIKPYYPRDYFQEISWIFREGETELKTIQTIASLATPLLSFSPTTKAFVNPLLNGASLLTFSQKNRTELALAITKLLASIFYQELEATLHSLHELCKEFTELQYIFARSGTSRSYQKIAESSFKILHQVTYLYLRYSMRLEVAIFSLSLQTLLNFYEGYKGLCEKKYTTTFTYWISSLIQATQTYRHVRFIAQEKAILSEMNRYLNQAIEGIKDCKEEKESWNKVKDPYFALVLRLLGKQDLFKEDPTHQQSPDSSDLSQMRHHFLNGNFDAVWNYYEGIKKRTDRNYFDMHWFLAYLAISPQKSEMTQNQAKIYTMFYYDKALREASNLLAQSKNPSNTNIHFSEKEGEVSSLFANKSDFFGYMQYLLTAESALASQIQGNFPLAKTYALRADQLLHSQSTQNWQINSCLNPLYHLILLAHHFLDRNGKIKPIDISEYKAFEVNKKSTLSFALGSLS